MSKRRMVQVPLGLLDRVDDLLENVTSRHGAPKHWAGQLRYARVTVRARVPIMTVAQLDAILLTLSTSQHAIPDPDTRHDHFVRSQRLAAELQALRDAD